MKCIILAHPEKPAAEKARLDIVQWLNDHDSEVVPEESEADIAIVLGGDGFLVRNIARFSQRNIPCFGINAGDVGFLTNGNISEWERILERLVRKEFKITKRVGLELILDGKVLGPFVNDVYMKHPVSMSYFKVKLNGEIVYQKVSSEGLVISTPVGSPAYNVSAGGPIIQPEVSCLILTPICSGDLNARPLVVSADSELDIEIVESKNSEKIYLGADGKILDRLSVGDFIRLRRSSSDLLFAIFDHHDFYRALQNKKGLMK